MTEFSEAHRALIDTVPLPAGSRIVEEVVDYEHESTPLEGYLAHDAAGTGERPAVLIVHDWTGLREYPKARAQMLARLGYVAFAIDVYGRGIRPTEGDAPAAEAGKYYGQPDLLRARVRAAYEVAAADDRVDAGRLAVIGYCFGGSAALEFARTDASVVGTATFHGGLIAHDPPDLEDFDAPLLVLTGGEDPVVPDSAVVALQEELRTRAGLDWQVVTYSGAPHAFTLPELPSWRPVADRRSWRELEVFLAEVFGGASA